jgi:zinc transport system permease protein
MLTLPAGSASNIAKSLASLMAYSVLASILFSTGGLALGWILDLPVGAVTVILAGLVFLAAAAHRALRKK